MKKFNRKTFKIGSFTLISTAIVLLVLIFINLLVSELPGSVTQIDTTKEQIFELREESLELLSKVDGEINIYMILEPDSETDTTTQVQSLIMRYIDASKNINYSVVDPVARPTFTAQYTDESLPNGSLIVESGSRSRVINGNEWFMYETEYGAFDAETYAMYYSYGYVDGTDSYMFYGEKNITGAIDFVTAVELPKAYILTGHGESDISSTFMDYIAGQNIETSALSLITGDGKVPDDCDMMIINIPDTDISEEESAALTEYFENGGNILLMTYNGTYSKELMPNLAKTAEAMGLTSVDGCVVEGNSNYYLSSFGGLYIAPMPADNNAAYSLVDQTYRCILPLAHGIEAVEDTDAVVYGLLETSDSAYIKSINDISEGVYDKTEEDPAGPFNIAALSTLTSGETVSNFLWVSSPYLTSTDYDNGGNSALFVSAVNLMCDKEYTTSLLGVKISVTPLNITSESTIASWSTVLTWIIPLIFLGSGLAVWIVRRRK